LLKALRGVTPAGYGMFPVIFPHYIQRTFLYRMKSDTRYCCALGTCHGSGS